MFSSWNLVSPLGFSVIQLLHKAAQRRLKVTLRKAHFFINSILPIFHDIEFCAKVVQNLPSIPASAFLISSKVSSSKCITENAEATSVI